MRRRVGYSLAGGVLLFGLVYFLTGTVDHRRPGPGLSLVDVLGGDVRGYEQARGVRTFSFPRDHGPHPAFKSEWWYYTGNLDTPDGRHFGYQLTFFRSALSPAPIRRDSAWATNQIYMAHLAVTDVDGGGFYAFERLSRAALDLAGGRAEPYRVWLENWSAAGSGTGLWPMRLRASQEDVAIDLTLEAGKPVVLHGQAGLSAKGNAAGDASYYYSFTRMPTRGSIRIGLETVRVSGLSWMDREWSTSYLSRTQFGWDWFSAQLSDGTELMCFQIRGGPANGTPFRGGTLIDADGVAHALRADQIEFEVLARWQGSAARTRYPAAWRILVPGHDLVLDIRPYLADQEFVGVVHYWEGAVRIVGRREGLPLSGSGYAELTGYATATGGTARTAGRSAAAVPQSP